MKKVVLISVLIFLVSCGKMKPNLALEAVYIKPGTKKEKVVKLLGKPQKVVILKSKEEIWIYQQDDKILRITFKNGVVEDREYDETE